MILNYVLDDDGEAIPEPDLMAWAQWFENSWPARQVARTEIGDVHVSTVFLAHDHNFWGVGPPVLWETMIFGGEHDQAQWRWRSKIAALAGHDRVVAAVRAGAHHLPPWEGQTR